MFNIFISTQFGNKILMSQESPILSLILIMFKIKTRMKCVTRYFNLSGFFVVFYFYVLCKSFGYLCLVS